MVSVAVSLRDNTLDTDAVGDRRPLRDAVGH